MPSTRGASGPTTVRSILFFSINFCIFKKLSVVSGIFTHSAISEIPAFPGKQNIFSISLLLEIFQVMPVSYTHLDVYKRQVIKSSIF